jgi:hypothetical protein
MHDAESEAALAAAFEKGRVEEVTRLYRRDDLPEENCWLRGTGWSFNKRISVRAPAFARLTRWFGS